MRPTGSTRSSVLSSEPSYPRRLLASCASQDRSELRPSKLSSPGQAPNSDFCAHRRRRSSRAFGSNARGLGAIRRDESRERCLVTSTACLQQFALACRPFLIRTLRQPGSPLERHAIGHPTDGRVATASPLSRHFNIGPTKPGDAHSARRYGRATTLPRRRGDSTAPGRSRERRALSTNIRALRRINSWAGRSSAGLPLRTWAAACRASTRERGRR
jgi:hypothetical protein